MNILQVVLLLGIVTVASASTQLLQGLQNLLNPAPTRITVRAPLAPLPLKSVPWYAIAHPVTLAPHVPPKVVVEYKHWSKDQLEELRNKDPKKWPQFELLESDPPKKIKKKSPYKSFKPKDADKWRPKHTYKDWDHSEKGRRPSSDERAVDEWLYSDGKNSWEDFDDSAEGFGAHHSDELNFRDEAFDKEDFNHRGEKHRFGRDPAKRGAKGIPRQESSNERQRGPRGSGEVHRNERPQNGRERSERQRHSEERPHESSEKTYQSSERPSQSSERHYPSSERIYQNSERPYRNSEEPYQSSERPYELHRDTSERPFPVHSSERTREVNSRERPYINERPVKTHSSERSVDAHGSIEIRRDHPRNHESYPEQESDESPHKPLRTQRQSYEQVIQQPYSNSDGPFKPINRLHPQGPIQERPESSERPHVYGSSELPKRSSAERLTGSEEGKRSLQGPPRSRGPYRSDTRESSQERPANIRNGPRVPSFPNNQAVGPNDVAGPIRAPPRPRPNTGRRPSRPARRPVNPTRGQPLRNDYSKEVEHSNEGATETVWGMPEGQTHIRDSLVVHHVVPSDPIKHSPQENQEEPAGMRREALGPSRPGASPKRQVTWWGGSPAHHEGRHTDFTSGFENQENPQSRRRIPYSARKPEYEVVESADEASKELLDHVHEIRYVAPAGEHLEFVPDLREEDHLNTPVEHKHALLHRFPSSAASISPTPAASFEEEEEDYVDHTPPKISRAPLSKKKHAVSHQFIMMDPDDGKKTSGSFQSFQVHHSY